MDNLLWFVFFIIKSLVLRLFIYLFICLTYCMVRPCVRDDKPRAVSEWLLSVHTNEPYNKLLIALLAPCTLCISGYLTLNTYTAVTQ